MEEMNRGTCGGKACLSLPLKESRRSCIVALNALSVKLYGKELRISGILTNAGFSHSDIEYLQCDGLDKMLFNMDICLRSLFAPHRKGNRYIDILYGRFALFGEKKQTLQEIGERYGVSRQCISYDEAKLLKRLKRDTGYKACIISAARTVLGMEPPCAESAEPKAEHCEYPYKIQPFVMTDKIRYALEKADGDMTVGEMAAIMNAERGACSRFKCRMIKDYLVDKGYIELICEGERSVKIPTDKGLSVGISCSERIYDAEPVRVIVYSKAARSFLLNRFDEILLWNRAKRKNKS